MDLLSDTESVRARQPVDDPVCVLARAGDHALLGAATELLGLDAVDHAEPVSSRPLVRVEGDARLLVVFAGDDAGQLIRVRLHAVPAGALVVVEDGVPLSALERAVDMAAESDEAVAGVLLALARLSEERTEALIDRVIARPWSLRLSRSTDERAQLTAMRAQALTLQHVYSAQARFADADGELAEVMPGVMKILRRAGAAFHYAATFAERLSAALADVLSSQNSLVMERLTLISTIFLPLTLATSFFGMNFRWMTDHIGSVGAFVALGIVSPLLITAATMLAVRRYSNPPEPTGATR